MPFTSANLNRIIRLVTCCVALLWPRPAPHLLRCRVRHFARPKFKIYDHLELKECSVTATVLASDWSAGSQLHLKNREEAPTTTSFTQDARTHTQRGRKREEEEERRHITADTQTVNHTQLKTALTMAATLLGVSSHLNFRDSSPLLLLKL